jgi:hypothetical protein
MWLVKKWKLNARLRFSGGKKRSAEVRQTLDTGNVFEEMGKVRRQNRCRQVEYIQNTPSIDLYGKA